MDISLITSTVITGGVSISAFASGVKSFKIFTVKQEKRDAIKLLAQSKLDSIADIMSQAMQDRDFSSIEFHEALQEVERYRKLKADIKNQGKTKVRQITKEQREELLEKRRNEGKDFLRKIANISDIQGVNVI